VRTQSIVRAAAVLVVSMALPVVARGQVAAARTCPVENAQVSVMFNGVDMDVAAVRSKLDAKVAEVKALAEEQHFTKLVLQSYNYNINANYSAGVGSEMHFQYSGNFSFVILPADRAVDFMQMLAKKGYQASVNVSSYNNAGNCNQIER